MKRIIAIILTLIMVLALTGCHKNDPTVEPQYADGQGTSSNIDLSAFEGKQLKPYIEMIASNNFYYQKTDANGDAVTFTRIGTDEKVSVAGGASFIKRGDKIYYVQGNYYCELSDTFVSTSGIEASYEDIKTVIASYEALVMGMIELVPSELGVNANFEGYTHEEYIDIENNIGYSFLFDAAGNLSTVIEVTKTDGSYNSYDVTMGTPSANAISNIFENGTLVDNQTAIEGAVQQQTATTTQGPTTTVAGGTVTTTAAPAAPVVP